MSPLVTQRCGDDGPGFVQRIQNEVRVRSDPRVAPSAGTSVADWDAPRPKCAVTPHPVGHRRFRVGCRPERGRTWGQTGATCSGAMIQRSRSMELAASARGEVPLPERRPATRHPVRTPDGLISPPVVLRSMLSSKRVRARFGSTSAKVRAREFRLITIAACIPDCRASASAFSALGNQFLRSRRHRVEQCLPRPQGRSRQVRESHRQLPVRRRDRRPRRRRRNHPRPGTPSRSDCTNPTQRGASATLPVEVSPLRGLACVVHARGRGRRVRYACHAATISTRSYPATSLAFGKPSTREGGIWTSNTLFVPA